MKISRDIAFVVVLVVLTVLIVIISFPSAAGVYVAFVTLLFSLWATFVFLGPMQRMKSISEKLLEAVNAIKNMEKQQCSCQKEQEQKEL